MEISDGILEMRGALQDLKEVVQNSSRTAFVMSFVTPSPFWRHHPRLSSNNLKRSLEI